MKNTLIQSVQRALDILELFNLRVSELSVKEISESLKLSKGTTHGLIRTLEYRGYLEQNPINQKYKLGLRLFEIGNLVGSQLDIRRLSYAIIQKLVDEIEETVHLVILDGKEVVYIEKEEGPGALRMYSQVGKRAPLHCTGVGKAIFAYLGEDKIDEILRTTQLSRFTPHTVTDSEGIKKELETIRKNGFAVDDEEIELGLRCVAAPIFNHEGEVFASISCAGPMNRMTDEKISDIQTKIKRAALDISNKLGFRRSLP